MDNLLTVPSFDQADFRSDYRPPKPIIKQMEPCLDDPPGFSIIGIDFETNGLGWSGKYLRTEVLEIGAMHFASGSVFHSLINPGDVEWNTEAEKVHQITESMAKDENVLEWDSVWHEFLEWVARLAGDRQVILMAHNGIQYDFPIIFENTGGMIDRNWFFFDTLLYAKDMKARRLLPKGQKLALDELANKFGIRPRGQAPFL